MHIYTASEQSSLIFFSFVANIDNPRHTLFLKKAYNQSNAISQMLSSKSDEELILSLNKQSYNDIVNEIFNRYAHILYGLCFRYFKNTEESKDAVQMIFEKVFTDIGSQKVRNLKSWLYVVAKNHCLMQIRRKQIETKEIGSESVTPILQKLYDEEMSSQNENEESENQATKLMQCIDMLSNQQGVCINLMYLESKSYKEIAEITGYTTNEVKSFIQNGKRNLRKLLTQHHEE